MARAKAESRCIVGDCKRRKAPGFDRCPGHEPGVADGKRPRRAQRVIPDALGPRFCAKYTDGFCPGCRRPIRAGQYVRAWERSGQQYTVYVHEGCAVKLGLLGAGEATPCEVEGCERHISAHGTRCWIHATRARTEAYQRGVLRGRAMGRSVDALTGEVSDSDPRYGSEEFEVRWRTWMLKPDGAEESRTAELKGLGAGQVSEEEAAWLASKGWAVEA